MTNYRKSLTEAYREVQERELTPKELKRREEIAKDLPIKDFEKRYGKEKGMQVKMATATKMAKKESFELDEVSMTNPQSLSLTTKDALVVRAKQLREKGLGLKARIEIANKIEIKSPSLFKYYRELEKKGIKKGPEVKKFDKQLMSALAKKFGQDIAKKTEKALKEEIVIDKELETLSEKFTKIDPKVVDKVKTMLKDPKQKSSLKMIMKHMMPKDVVKMLHKEVPATKELSEDGHTDVASAVRSCKTITEDANEIMGKLNSMSPEDSLPSWWTNKLAVASNSMNKMRDYILNPIQENVIQEAPGDLEDMKKVVDELKKASQMHLGQSKRVQAHIGMMEKGE